MNPLKKNDMQREEIRKEIARKHIVEGKSYLQLQLEYETSHVTIGKAIKKYRHLFENK